MDRGSERHLRHRRRLAENESIMKDKARPNGKLVLPAPGAPSSPLGRKLMRLRKRIENSGERLMTSAEVRREVLRRRGLA